MENTAVNQIQIREAVLRNLTPEQIKNRQAEFVISTEAEDTYRTVFKMEGWKLERYASNPLVCYNHYSWGNNPDTIIGTSEVFIEENRLIGRLTFEDAEDNPLAEKVFRKVQKGTLRMASISADIKKYHWGNSERGENPEIVYFDEMELLEWSIVSIGSNPDALKRNAEALEQFKKEVPENIVPTEQTRKLSINEAQFKYNRNLK